MLEIYGQRCGQNQFLKIHTFGVQMPMKQNKVSIDALALCVLLAI